MSDLSHLSDTFRHIATSVRKPATPRGKAHIAADTACSAFESALTETILPRRITARGEGGARLSVVAKNRRVIKVAEVHPPELWVGTDAPQETECGNDFDGFAKPFASTLLKVIGEDGIRIERSLLSEKLGPTKPGYTAAMLSAHVMKAQQSVPVLDGVGTLFEAFPTATRARFGAKMQVEIADGSLVTKDWLDTRIIELLDEMTDEPELRFIILEGDAPLVVAMVWMGGEGCLIVSETPNEFSDLERQVNALRKHL